MCVCALCVCVCVCVCACVRACVCVYSNMPPRTLCVGQLQDEKCVIGKNLFKKETNIQAFVGLRVTLSTGKRCAVIQ